MSCKTICLVGATSNYRKIKVAVNLHLRFVFKPWYVDCNSIINNVGQRNRIYLNKVWQLTGHSRMHYVLIKQFVALVPFLEPANGLSVIVVILTVPVVDIHIRSGGCDDAGRKPSTSCGFAYIEVNGKDYSPHLRGYNVVVVDGATGKRRHCLEFASIPFSSSLFQASVGWGRTSSAWRARRK